MIKASTPAYHRPTIKPLLTRAPAVDLSPLRDGTARSRVILDIGDACRHAGHFQIVNHGIHESIIGGAIEAASRFFEWEGDEKEKLISEDLGRAVRYGEAPTRSMLKHYAHPLSKWIRFWPSNPPNYRGDMASCTTAVRRVALLVLGAVFESLGLGETYLEHELADGLQLVAVNRYPIRTGKGTAIGAAPHTDPGLLTIVLQSCEGLQVLGGGGEGWKTVSAVSPGTLHVHVGDYLEVLSNGRYRSSVHRAMLHPEEERISIACVQNLAIDAVVAPAAELVDEQRPPGYRNCSFREFLDYQSKDSEGRRFLDTLRISGTHE